MGLLRFSWVLCLLSWTGPVQAKCWNPTPADDVVGQNGREVVGARGQQVWVAFLGWKTAVALFVIQDATWAVLDHGTEVAVYGVRSLDVDHHIALGTRPAVELQTTWDAVSLRRHGKMLVARTQAVAQGYWLAGAGLAHHVSSFGVGAQERVRVYPWAPHHPETAGAVGFVGAGGIDYVAVFMRRCRPNPEWLARRPGDRWVAVEAVALSDRFSDATWRWAGRPMLLE